MLAMRWCATRPAYALALEVLQANPSQYSHRLCRSSVVVFGARLGAKVKPRPSREGDLVSSQPHLVFRASRACKSRIHVDAVVKARSEGRSAQSRRFVVHVAWAFASALASGRSMEIGRMVSPQRGLRWDVVHVEDREEERCDGTVGIIADARWLVYRPIAVRA
jgi:hypothetical protein